MWGLEPNRTTCKKWMRKRVEINGFYSPNRHYYYAGIVDSQAARRRRRRLQGEAPQIGSCSALDHALVTRFHLFPPYNFISAKSQRNLSTSANSIAVYQIPPTSIRILLEHQCLRPKLITQKNRHCFCFPVRVWSSLDSEASLSCIHSLKSLKSCGALVDISAQYNQSKLILIYPKLSAIRTSWVDCWGDFFDPFSIFERELLASHTKSSLLTNTYAHVR